MFGPEDQIVDSSPSPIVILVTNNDTLLNSKVQVVSLCPFAKGAFKLVLEFELSYLNTFYNLLIV